MSFQVVGLKDVNKVFQELSDEIGDKKATSKILIPAVREAMKPVLDAARADAPEDTGALKRSLQIEARRPNRRDKKSKYVSSTDNVIAVVTTASGKKLKKMGIKSDARSIAQEFGTAKHPAHPYLRPALESEHINVANKLGAIISKRLDRYKNI